jgi:hypothetical protein
MPLSRVPSASIPHLNRLPALTSVRPQVPPWGRVVAAQHRGGRHRCGAWVAGGRAGRL